MKVKNTATAAAILAAALYAINIPLSKLLLRHVDATMLAALLYLGFVAYGLSIYFYILAQKHLGAAKTCAYYSVAPFLGVAFGLVLLGEKPSLQFYAALLIMAISTILMVRDSISLQHTYEHAHTHTHEHSLSELADHQHVHDNA